MAWSRPRPAATEPAPPRAVPHHQQGRDLNAKFRFGPDDLDFESMFGLSLDEPFRRHLVRTTRAFNLLTRGENLMQKTQWTFVSHGDVSVVPKPMQRWRPCCTPCAGTSHTVVARGNGGFASHGSGVSRTRDSHDEAPAMLWTAVDVRRRCAGGSTNERTKGRLASVKVSARTDRLARSHSDRSPLTRPALNTSTPGYWLAAESNSVMTK